MIAAAPRKLLYPQNPTLIAKARLDPTGKISHLRILQLWHPELPNTDAINAQSIDDMKRWHYKPQVVSGKAVAVCSDVTVTIDMR